MTITTIGLDLAKNVSQVHGVDEHGNVVLRKQIPPLAVVGVLRELAGLPNRHGGL